MIMILETQRLSVREMLPEDAPFFFELANDDDWKRFIGDRNIHTIQDAENYLTERIIPSYTNSGFGFYLVIEKDTETPVGITGFVKRDQLQHVDVGFAFLPIGRGKGYAFESTEAIMQYGYDTLGFSTVMGIANNDNERSHLLLKKLGLKFEKHIKLSQEAEEISLFST